MIVNFRTRRINRGARKLTRTPILIKKKNNHYHIVYNRKIKVTWPPWFAMNGQYVNREE